MKFKRHGKEPPCPRTCLDTVHQRPFLLPGTQLRMSSCPASSLLTVHVMLCSCTCEPLIMGQTFLLNSWFYLQFLFLPGRDSSVGIATRFGLDCPGIESQCGVRFSAPVQTGCGAHPASCTMGTASFPGVKRPGSGADHPPPSSVPRS